MSSPFAPSEERNLLRDAVRRLLTDHADARAVIHTDGAHDEALWGRLSEQVGVPSLLIPEDWGGAGATVADVTVVMEELGAAVAPVPVLSTVGIVTPVLRAIGATETAKRIATGDAIATLVIDPLTDPWSAAARSAVRIDGEDRATGTVNSVLDAAAADLLIVVAPGSDGIAVTAVNTAGAGVTVTAVPSLDLTRGLCRVEFEAAEGELLASGPDVEALIGSGLDVALVLQAAELVGLAQRRHDEAVRYAGERVQFDRPIGSFQAVKHLLVDLLLDIELARSAMIAAAGAADWRHGQSDDASVTHLRVQASLAAASCKDMAMRVARETLHVFGGIGFTWEHDAHLAFRRAKACELLLGSPPFHRRRMVAALRA